MADATENFLHWLRVAKPGDVCVYHTGDLSYERSMGRGLNGASSRGGMVEWPEHMKEKAKAIHNLAKAVWTAYKLGDVVLTQKKLETNIYAYRATRTKRDRAI